MKTIKKLTHYSVALLTLASLTSCATIMHGTRQSIGISSCPSNACVWVDQMFIGYTPVIVEMTRKDNHFLRVELEGYQPYEATFSRQLSGWVLGNIVFGGIIGLAIDAISGGIYKLTPDQIQAELRANNMCHVKKSQDSYIAIVLKPDPAWEKIGNLKTNSL
ncbi:MAG: PEGA domain-containing protein [Parachlamydiaceae bacterium]|nr:PEGA domain-containing protein [Parachlamydiaceae bacterium]